MFEDAFPNLKSGKLKVVFSNEKQPGEGEHKLIDYIRKYCTKDQTFCINALDADLVMLSLATFNDKFYLLRDETFNKSNNFTYSYVSIGELSEKLVKTMEWSGCGNKEKLIKDFILICFLCGNDFLPNIPSISILENGLDIMIDLYKSGNAHMVDDDNKILFDAFGAFLKKIGNSEEGMLVQKALNKKNYIPDPLLEQYTETSCIQDDMTRETIELTIVNVPSYKESYYSKKNIKCISSACHHYLEGCQWVFTYYISGISDWSWVYPYNYAPFAEELAKSITGFVPRQFSKTFPISPFEQLLCVIPPWSSNLLPKPLNELLSSREFEKFCPSNVVVNCDGKKFEYEGIVELPIMSVDLVKRSYSRLRSGIEASEMRRNITGKAFIYRVGEFTEVFKSYYGDIKSHKVEVEKLDL